MMDQMDLPGAGDELRRALEAKAQGRKRSARPQKAPGSDGGLFDELGGQPELF